MPNMMDTDQSDDEDFMFDYHGLAYRRHQTNGVLYKKIHSICEINLLPDSSKSIVDS